MRILSKEEYHPALSASYSQLMNTPVNSIQTWAHTLGLPRLIAPVGINTTTASYHELFMKLKKKELVTWYNNNEFHTDSTKGAFTLDRISGR